MAIYSSCSTARKPRQPAFGMIFYFENKSELASFAQVNVNNLRQFPRSDTSALLQDLRRLERKTFPPSQVFPFEDNLSTKHNTHVYVVLSDVPNTGRLAAYAICVKFRHRLLLHKVCVSVGYKRQGIGFALLSTVIEHARTWSCRAIDLWVQSDNDAAMQLYIKSGFSVQSTVLNYYAPGKTGIKMSHPLQS